MLMKHFDIPLKEHNLIGVTFTQTNAADVFAARKKMTRPLTGTSTSPCSGMNMVVELQTPISADKNS
jgi:hypothetical protein